MIDLLYVLLLAASALSALGSGIYLAVYARLADWRDPRHVNAWFGGLAFALLSVASVLYLLGHYGLIGSYTPPLAVATAGFAVAAGVWIHRASLVLRMARD